MLIYTLHTEIRLAMAAPSYGGQESFHSAVLTSNTVNTMLFHGLSLSLTRDTWNYANPVLSH